MIKKIFSHSQKFSLILRLAFVGAAVSYGLAGLQTQELTREEALEKTLDIAGIKPGAVIGEVGAGEGFFTAELIKRLGENVRIFANDIDGESLESLKKRDFKNVEVVLGETDDPKFPAGDLDAVIMRSVFHDLENPLSMLENIKKYLKPGAPLVIIDSLARPPLELTSLPMHNLTEEEFLRIVDRSSFELIHFLSLARAGYAVLMVNKDKEERVWTGWLDDFRQGYEETREFEEKGNVSAGKKRISWERLLDSYRDNNPESDEDERLRKDIERRIAALLKTTDKVPPKRQVLSFQSGTRLRAVYRSIGMDDIAESFKKLGFGVRGRIRAISGDFPNEYEKLAYGGDHVILDRSTGLMWHPNGSENTLDYFSALEWIDSLNEQKYGGHSDWRMPTVEEAMSIIETEKRNGDLFIDPLFSGVQGVIWTGDGFYPGRLWLIRLYRASIADDLKVHLGWVRPVRSTHQKSGDMPQAHKDISSRILENFRPFLYH